MTTVQFAYLNRIVISSGRDRCDELQVAMRAARLFEGSGSACSSPWGHWACPHSMLPSRPCPLGVINGLVPAPFQNLRPVPRTGLAMMSRDRVSPSLLRNPVPVLLRRRQHRPYTDSWPPDSTLRWCP